MVHSFHPREIPAKVESLAFHQFSAHVQERMSGVDVEYSNDDVVPSALWVEGSKVMALDRAGKWHAALVVEERSQGNKRELLVRHEVQEASSGVEVGHNVVQHYQWLSVAGGELRAAGGKLDPSKATVAPRRPRASSPLRQPGTRSTTRSRLRVALCNTRSIGQRSRRACSHDASVLLLNYNVVPRQHMRLNDVAFRRKGSFPHRRERARRQTSSRSQPPSHG